MTWLLDFKERIANAEPRSIRVGFVSHPIHSNGSWTGTDWTSQTWAQSEPIGLTRLISRHWRGTWAKAKWWTWLG